MLRRSAEEGKDWDKLLPYVLFAYREVPQETTGFSPFEMLYGREVRGPLDVIRETWEADVSSGESIVSYVVGMRERLEAMAVLAKKNVGKAQRHQKAWFDRQARERELKVGEKVLILLPTSASKLLAKWQGPFVVKGRKGRVNYEVDMGERRKKCRTFHTNMLKPWVECDEMSLWESEGNVGESCKKEEEEEIATWEEGTSIKRKPKWGTELDVKRKREMEEVLKEFEDVLSGGTGRTGLVKHDIDVKGSKPIRLSPNRVPQMYRGWMREELDRMSEDEIIEESVSPWGAPVVLVKKKDGSLRFCIDYRRLNGKADLDAYPMPRIEELIDRLGGAQYLTTIDLARGQGVDSICDAVWAIPI